MQGTPDAAESSFYKINTQGTPLDEIEEMLIRNRRKPIAISARAILRAGKGHKYWLGFGPDVREKVEQQADKLYNFLFEPEANTPIKTLDLPLGGALSPVDALSVLVELLTITTGEQVEVSARGSGSTRRRLKTIDEYGDDESGEKTVKVLEKALRVIERVTGDTPRSLGLHPAVYFYTERGRHNRFLFLAIMLLIATNLKNNNDNFFTKFTDSRAKLENFLVKNKSLIGILLQNMSKTQRVDNTQSLFEFLISEFAEGRNVTPEAAIAHLGLRGRVIDVEWGQTTPHFTDEVKSQGFLEKALSTAQRCEICGGFLDPAKSVSYDHRIPRRDGGTGEVGNLDLVHPYCNTGYKN